MSCVVLASDFGINDPYVGIIKGVIRNLCEDVPIIDLTHNIPSFDIAVAQFIIKYSYVYFPKGSIFLVAIDPEVGSDAKPIVVKRDSYFFVGRDNGVLTFDDKFEVFEVKEEFDIKSNTFHARDVFSQIVCKLLKNTINLFKTEEFVKFNMSEVEFKGNRVTGDVIWIDKFGNIITNIKAEGNEFLLEINGNVITTVSKYYGQCESGIFIIVDSFGFLEISCYRKSAANLLSAHIGDKITIRSNP